MYSAFRSVPEIGGEIGMIIENHVPHHALIAAYEDAGCAHIAAFLRMVEEFDDEEREAVLKIFLRKRLGREKTSFTCPFVFFSYVLPVLQTGDRSMRELMEEECGDVVKLWESTANIQ